MSEHKLLGKDIRKVIPVGDSLAITIPKEYVQAHSIKKGDSMEVLFNEIIHITPLNLDEIEKKLKGNNGEEAAS